MTVHHLDSPPRLPVALARGALASLGKRGPYEGARLPGERLVLPGACTDAGRLRAYARVCGFPEGGDRLPPSYPHVLGFPLAMRLMSAPAFPFPLLGLVHTGIELTQHRALHAGDRPEIAVHAEGLAPHRRGSRFTVVTEARLAGELVWHSRSDYLCRHRTTAAQAEPSPPSPSPSREEPAAPLPVRATWELPAGLGRRYAAASGDRNPIHLHPLTAKPFGFPRHIAHGMWTFARCLAEAGTHARGQQGERLTARAEFRAPVLLPSTVAYGAEGAADSGEGLRFELRGGREGARLHLSGEVREVSSGSPS